MVSSMDFVPSLKTDMSFKILMSLDDPSDLARASCVSHAWHDFVVSQGLCKQLCVRKFPRISRVDHVKEASDLLKNYAETGCSSFRELEKFRREHRIFSFLAHCCTTYPLRNCIFEAISASSTDNFPEESIDNSLEVRERVGQMASYWTSKGQKDPSVPETLIYKLLGDICVISEIGIQPFEGHLIYSASHVRFRVGYSVGPVAMADVDADLSGQMHGGCADEKKIGCKHLSFKSLFFVSVDLFSLSCLAGCRDKKWMACSICVTHVQVIGRCLSTSFGVEALKPSGNFVLKRLTEETLHTMPMDKLPIHSRNLGRILNMLRGNDVNIGYACGEGEDESDEEFV